MCTPQKRYTVLLLTTVKRTNNRPHTVQKKHTKKGARTPEEKRQQQNTMSAAAASSSSTMDDYRDSFSMEDDDNNTTRSYSSYHTSPSLAPHPKSLSLPQYPGSPANSLHQRRQSLDLSKSQEPEMVDATYSEYYGALYTGKPIKYIYPQGYGSMRPRSTPWKISIILFGVFAWLNVFIVGHCANGFKWQQQNDDKYQNDNDGGQTDDAVVMESRWCGSRTLYFTWVLSVALTGVSFAYCSIIGYVKARDFAVANGRSQPPGMVGKSDYYVQMEEVVQGLEGGRRFSGSGGGSFQGGGVSNANVSANGVPLKTTIYQADGTPRFFGGQIYKPTQAAVSLTSR
jgi:hypothetical protein